LLLKVFVTAASIASGARRGLEVAGI
jgi:hypothetical protein